MTTFKRVYHNGRDIGGIYKGTVIAIGTYPKTNMRSVLLSRPTREECEKALKKPMWRGVVDIEIKEWSEV